MQKLGQHFLKNAAVLEKIVDALAIAEGECVIEIGPGHGELTTSLLRAARNKNGEFFCVEKDHALIEGLEVLATKENSLTGKAWVHVVEGDALKLLSRIVPAATSYKIVGNIPYYITGKLLRIVSELGRQPERTVLLVQKEVAERMCARPGSMNRLAASVQFWADASIVAQVPRKDFSPMPEVDSAVVVLEKKHGKKQEEGIAPAKAADYYRAVRVVFAQPRKTLLNNLSAAASTPSKDEIGAVLQTIGIDPGARPQDLSVEQLSAIATMPLWG